MAKFDSKSFNPEAFGAYIKRIPNVTKNELAKSGAVGTNDNAKQALNNQTGSLYARIPYFGRISGTTSQNNDGATNIASTSSTTFEQGFVTASRMDAWTEKSFSKNITAGVDFMDNVASQIADYKHEVRQRMLLAILQGIFSMDGVGNTVPEKAAAEFLERHVYDITAPNDADKNCVDSATLNKAIQKACGDNKNIFKLVIMHSEVATRLENMKLLKFMTQTDADGIERELALGTWNGRLVLVDDDMPVSTGYYAATSSDEGALKCVSSSPNAGEILISDVQDADFYPAVQANDYVVAGEKYTTYILGDGAIVLDDIGDSVPYEMSRDPKTNGGQDTLYVRDRYICGVDGISFEKPAALTASASNAQLADGDNWNIINDGTNWIPTKSIAICKVVSRG